MICLNQKLMCTIYKIKMTLINNHNYFDKKCFRCRKQISSTILKILKEKQGDDHTSTALLYFKIGWIYFKTGKYELAYDYGNKSLEIRKSILPPRHPDIVKSERLITPISPSSRERTATSPFSFSLSPITSIKGIFCI